MTIFGNRLSWKSIPSIPPSESEIAGIVVINLGLITFKTFQEEKYLE